MILIDWYGSSNYVASVDLFWCWIIRSKYIGGLNLRAPSSWYSIWMDKFLNLRVSARMSSLFGPKNKLVIFLFKVQENELLILSEWTEAEVCSSGRYSCRKNFLGRKIRLMIRQTPLLTNALPEIYKIRQFNAISSIYRLEFENFSRNYICLLHESCCY